MAEKFSASDVALNGLPEREGPRKKVIIVGAVVTALDQTPDGAVAHYKTPAGRFEARGDFMIITVPFAVLRHMKVIKPFSRAKQKAIRQLHYDASAKIFLQCKRRFWEEDEGIFGGGTITDLAIRNMYYPEHGRETRRGVILASYTWSEDAERWGSLSPDDRIDQAIESAIVVGVQLPKRGLQECNAHRAPTRLLQQR